MKEEGTMNRINEITSKDVGGGWRLRIVPNKDETFQLESIREREPDRIYTSLTFDTVKDARDTKKQH